ncbi:FAD:protein FMN transferase [Crassaminicella profunda]|uniref:FAD:protein FMN transferase n=1 Tax=Crassaminicella profunda TaxID=1286698 RepID=UPI001CA6C032|nr:FAD:protein FMN transferase [Crassaminicella profunda]QZY56609.1 FAD:protein FMN transferase [Crassaminicella profunda]
MKKNFNIYFCIIILLFISLLSGCSKKKEVVTDSAYMLGTHLNISIWTEDENKGKEVIKECFERISEIEKKMSANIKDSEVNQINNNEENRLIKVSTDTSNVLNKALEYAKISNGVFDPTIGKLVKLWGIGTENEKVPQRLEIDDALKYVNYKLLKKEENNAYKLDKEGMRIDLGGIAKGYAADEVYRILKNKGVEHAVINLGGNIYTLGTRQDGQIWKIGIQDPFEPTGTYMGIVQFSDKAIVTSGNYERFFVKNNKRYHHIIDPKTGYPSENGIISSTIIANHSMDADALSTSVYILGVKKGLALVEKIENVECIIVTKDHKVYLSSGMKGKLNIENDRFQIEN